MTMLIRNVLMGSDPEVFIYSPSTESVFPVLDMIGGSKDNPRPMSENGFFVQEDNVLAEFNIPPSASRGEFVLNIGRGIELLAEILPPGFVPLVKSSHTFQEVLLSDPRAMMFGCNPDFNAWTGEQNEAPDPLNFPTLRSSGGHVVVGYENPSPEINRKLVKLQDAYLGIPSILLDKDKDRRKLYGKAGAYRDKPYGVEYRTLSSFWIASPRLVGWVWDQTNRAINDINNGNDVLIEDEDLIVNIINNADEKKAEEFVKTFGLVMP